MKLLCINDKEPVIDTWIEAGKEYTLLHVYRFPMQKCLGVQIKEINIERITEGVFVAFKLSRFAMRQEDLAEFFTLCFACAELDDFSYEEILKDVELV